MSDRSAVHVRCIYWLVAATLINAVGGCAATYQRVDSRSDQPMARADESVAVSDQPEVKALADAGCGHGLYEGDRARVTTTSGERFEGIVAAVGDSVSLMLSASGGAILHSIATGDIAVAEVRRGPAVFRGILGVFSLSAVVLTALIFAAGPMSGENGG